MLIKQKNLLFTLALCGAVFALYGQFLSNTLVFDDLPVRNNDFSLFALRSLPYATLEWGMDLFGGEIFYFRVESLLLHAATSIALYFLLLHIFQRLLPQSGGERLDNATLAFFAALLFALHPVAVYAAGYLVQRTIVMATLFSLLAMLAWLHGDEHESKPWLWGSVFFYYLAVFSKEHAIMLPAVILSLSILMHEDWRARLRQCWLVCLGFVVIALFVVAASKGVLGTVYEINAPEMLVEAESNLNYPLSVLTQSWLFFKYVALWLFPNPNWMSVDMREPFASSLWSAYLFAMAAFLAWGFLSLWLLFKRGSLGLLGFAMLFPWLMFMTEFSTVRIQESFVLYRSYLWVVGACAVLPLLMGGLNKRMASIVLCALTLAMFPISMDRLASFSHPLILWDDAVKLVKEDPTLPGAYRTYYNRGTELLKVDEYDAAILDLSLSIQLKPDWPFSHNNLGIAYMKKSDWKNGEAELTKAIDIASAKDMGFNHNVYLLRAIALENLGKSDLAQHDYKLTCKVAKKGCDKLR